MEVITRQDFDYYNRHKNKEIVFESLCLDFFRIKENIDDIIFIEPNNPGIETQPVRNGTIGFQAKYSNKPRELFKKSLTKEKLNIYESLDKIYCYTNGSLQYGTLKIELEKGNPGKIFEIFNGETLLSELQKEKYYSLHAKYFGIKDLIGFFTNQRPKGKEFDKNNKKYNENIIEISKKEDQETIDFGTFKSSSLGEENENNGGKIIMIEGAANSGKSYLCTYFLEELSKVYLNHVTGEDTPSFPIAISLFKRNGSCSLLDFINNQIYNYIPGNSIINYQKVIVFLDGVNEIPYSKKQVFEYSLDELNNNTAIQKIIITSRLGTNHSDWLDNNIVLRSYLLSNTNPKDYGKEFTRIVEELLNTEYLPYNRKELLLSFLGEIAYTYNRYDENSNLSISDLYKKVKLAFDLTNNTGVNEFIDKLFSLDVFVKIGNNKVMFVDQKLYEEIVAEYIKTYFFELLPDLRSRSFFFDNVFYVIESKLAKRNYSLGELSVKNYFFHYFYNSENSGWAFEESIELFTEVIIHIPNIKLLYNENKQLKNNIFTRNHPYLFWRFYQKGYEDIAKELSEKYIQRLGIVEHNIFEILEDKTLSDIEKDQKIREWNVENMYQGFEYNLKYNFSVAGEEILIPKERMLIWKLGAYTRFFINPLNETKLEKVFERGDSYIDIFLDEITKIGNIKIISTISENFKSSILSKIGDIQTLINNFPSYENDLFISKIVFFICVEGTVLTETQTKVIKDLLRKEVQELRKRGKYKQENFSKILLIIGILDSENEYDIENINNHSNWMGTIDPLIGLLKVFYQKNNNELLPVNVLLKYNQIQKYTYDKDDLNYLHGYVLGLIIGFFDIPNISLPKILGKNNKYFILSFIESDIKNKRIIFDNTDSSVFEINGEELGYNDRSIYLGYQTIKKSVLGTKDILEYFRLCLNNEVARYGWRKDYLLEYMIDIIEKTYKKGYLSDIKLLEYYEKVSKHYNLLIPHVDGKGIKNIPRTIGRSLGELNITIRQDEFQKFGLEDSFLGVFCLLRGYVNNGVEFDIVNKLLKKLEYMRYYEQERKDFLLFLIAKSIEEKYFLQEGEKEYIKNLVDYDKDEFKTIKIKDIKNDYFYKDPRIDQIIEKLESKGREFDHTIKGDDIDMEEDNSEESIIERNQEAIDNFFDYNIKDVLSSSHGEIISKLQEYYPDNYMSKVFNSDYWYFAGSSGYWFDSTKGNFANLLYDSNPYLFTKELSKYIKNHYYNDGNEIHYHYTNWQLTIDILLKEGNKKEIVVFIDNMMNFIEFIVR